MNSRSQIIHKLANSTGFKAKISAKCVECIFDPYQDGTWRKQVENCTCLTCPLYSVRPRTTGGKHG